MKTIDDDLDDGNAEFEDKNNPDFRFPLYQAIEKLQNQKIGRLKKL
mgnify:CR=1 FL=1